MRNTFSAEASYRRLMHEIRSIRYSLTLLSRNEQQEQQRQRRPWYRLRQRFVRGVAAFGIFGGIFTIVGYYLEGEDRRTTRIVNAWQLIAQTGSGNLGKREALQFLSSQDCVIGSGFESRSLASLLSEVISHPQRCAFGLAMGPRVDFAGLELAPLRQDGVISLDGLTLFDVAFENAIFSMVSLRSAQLSNVEFKNSILRGLSFTGARLYNMKVDSGELNCVSMEKVDVRSIDLFGSNVRSIEIVNSKFVGGRISAASMPRSLIFNTQFSGVQFLSGDMSNSILSHSLFSDGAVIENLVLAGADLSNTRFGSAIIRFSEQRVYHPDREKGVHPFKGAMLNGTDFSGASFDDVDLDGAQYCKETPPILPKNYSGPPPKAVSCDGQDYSDWYYKLPSYAHELDVRDESAILEGKPTRAMRGWSSAEHKSCGLEATVVEKREFRRFAPDP